ncbi:unnamed protein product, partial [Heterosigma akashiwo]
EFDVINELGTGNFTTVLHVRHKATKEDFAMKCIEKANAKRISRRHPNVYNEIHMERRVLIKFIGHPNIVHMYHTFQDHYSLYYLMELCEGGEVWKQITENGSLVGAHPSLASFYLAEVVSAVLHMHSHGVVHRDIKPENMMLTKSGHVKLIDFGSSKDLIDTDLNGPEFVGTPEFMSPEAVTSKEAGKEADLWALGCVAYQFFCGLTPFKAPSPFLSFSRIKLPNHTVAYREVLPAAVQDFCRRTLVVDPRRRLGAEGSAEGGGGGGAGAGHTRARRACGGGIARLSPPRWCPCWRSWLRRRRAPAALAKDHDVNVAVAARAFVEKLSPADRARVLHYLDRKGELKNPRCWRLFHATAVEARCTKARCDIREYVGNSYDAEGQWDKPFFFVHIGDPQLGCKKYDAGGGSSWETEAENMRKAVKLVNRLRPKYVVISGDMTNAYPGDTYHEAQLKDIRAITAKISDSIPVLFMPGNHDVGDVPSEETTQRYQASFGANYYVFWFGGVLNIVLDSTLFMRPEDQEDDPRLQPMLDWLEEQLETNKYSAQHVLVFLHHPIYAASPEEPDRFVEEAVRHVVGARPVAWSLPRRHRPRLLRLLADPAVKGVFAGHTHRNLARVHRARPSR